MSQRFIVVAETPFKHDLGGAPLTHRR
jgi:hypothetical protein